MKMSKKERTKIMLDIGLILDKHCNGGYNENEIVCAHLKDRTNDVCSRCPFGRELRKLGNKLPR